MKNFITKIFSAKKKTIIVTGIICLALFHNSHSPVFLLSARADLQNGYQE